ncbi:MAG: hypothetical protein AWU57_4397, partial [Marinobacter sp. T13-3]
VQQPLNVSTPLVDRHFRVAMSGEPVPDSFEYLDTALDPFGPEAYHVFEVPEEEMHAAPEEYVGEAEKAPLERTGWRAAQYVF